MKFQRVISKDEIKRFKNLYWKRRKHKRKPQFRLTNALLVRFLEKTAWVKNSDSLDTKKISKTSLVARASSKRVGPIRSLNFYGGNNWMAQNAQW